MARHASPDMNRAHAVFGLISQDKILRGLSASQHSEIKRYAHRTFDTHHSTHIQDLCNNEQKVHHGCGPVYNCLFTHDQIVDRYVAATLPSLPAPMRVACELLGLYLTHSSVTSAVC